jgi:hypothetical protein
MYVSRPYTGNTLQDLASHVQDQLDAIAQAQSDTLDFIQLNTLNREPERVREGIVAKADGTNWNPGSGAGFYGYRGGSWRKLD